MDILSRMLLLWGCVSVAGVVSTVAIVLAEMRLGTVELNASETATWVQPPPAQVRTERVVPTRAHDRWQLVLLQHAWSSARSSLPLSLHQGRCCRRGRSNAAAARVFHGCHRDTAAGVAGDRLPASA